MVSASKETEKYNNHAPPNIMHDACQNRNTDFITIFVRTEEKSHQNRHTFDKIGEQMTQINYLFLYNKYKYTVFYKQLFVNDIFHAAIALFAEKFRS